MHLVCIGVGVGVVLMCLGGGTAHEGAASPDEAEASAGLEEFHRGFRAKRMQQLHAVKHLLSLDSAERQTKLLDAMVQPMDRVLQQSRAAIESAGHIDLDESGQRFPSEPRVREALALLLENTCLLADVLLRWPDHVQQKWLKPRPELERTFKWGLAFMLERQTAPLIDDDATRTMLQLAAQEAGVLERQPDYHNPYKQVRPKQKRFEDPPPVKKKARKKLQKGPRLTKNEL